MTDISSDESELDENNNDSKESTTSCNSEDDDQNEKDEPLDDPEAERNESGENHLKPDEPDEGKH